MSRRNPHTKWFFYLLIVIIIGIVVIMLFPRKSVTTSIQLRENSKVSPVPSPTPFIKYTAPKLAGKNTYAVFLVGDSMTAAMGPHPSRLSGRLNEAYPDAGFIVDNYGVGSASILSLPKMLTEERTLDGKQEPSILDRDFDILIIESFANNPLSELPLEEGLQKQREILDLTIQSLIKEKPNSVIILLATLAPSDQYGLGSVSLSDQSRQDWANERRAYLEDFISYAEEKEFPLVNAYEDTLLPSGDVQPGFISENGNIHPTQMGIEFIQDSIADFIIEKEIIPAPDGE